MAFVAVYDACVLYPNSLRDLLVRIAVRGYSRRAGPCRFSTSVFEASSSNAPISTRANSKERAS